MVIERPHKELQFCKERALVVCEEYSILFKDTTEFLHHIQELEQLLPLDTLLFCFEGVKLYPSIPKKTKF